MGLRDWMNRDPDPAPPGAGVPPAPTAADIAASLAAVEATLVRENLPGVITSRVRHVVETLREILPRMATAGLTTDDEYAVVATATDYLPEALAAYLRLPRQWADHRPVDGAKTSLYLLVDQLDLLGGTVQKMYDAVCQADAVALITHGRFLQEKFGHGPVLPPEPPVTTRRSTVPSHPLDLDRP